MCDLCDVCAIRRLLDVRVRASVCVCVCACAALVEILCRAAVLVQEQRPQFHKQAEHG